MAAARVLEPAPAATTSSEAPRGESQPHFCHSSNPIGLLSAEAPGRVGNSDGRGRLARENTMGKLDGKVALISGGARGQGAAEAETFAREGAKVVFGDIRDDEGKKVEAAIRAAGATPPTCTWT